MKSPFENFKKADWIMVAGGLVLLVVLILAALGANKFLYKTPVLEEKNILFSVFFRGITITDSVPPFQVGENAFITIRNVPYTKLEIVDVQIDRRRMLIETDKKGNYQPVEDISAPFLFDAIVTLKDKAKITDDGEVVGGNKVKMGIPVVVEGQNYKFNGVISNVLVEAQVAPESVSSTPEQQPVNEQTQQNSQE